MKYQEFVARGLNTVSNQLRRGNSGENVLPQTRLPHSLAFKKNKVAQPAVVALLARRAIVVAKGLDKHAGATPAQLWLVALLGPQDFFFLKSIKPTAQNLKPINQSFVSSIEQWVEGFVDRF